MTGPLLFAITAVAFVLPGYILVALFTDDDEYEALDWLASIFLALALSIIVAGIVGILLAELGLFSVTALAAIALGLAAALWAVGFFAHIDMRWHPAATARNEWLAITLLLTSSALLFFHPHETITGGADAGVYVNVGANLAKTGALLIHEPLLLDLEPALWPGLMRQLPAAEQVDFIRFPGFYRSDTQIDQVIPQFFTLHPLWIAIAYRLGGLWAGLYMTPVWGVLGVWAVYLFARSLFSRSLDARSFAWLPALFLALTPLQIYFARYPTAEPISQFFFWVALWSFTLFAIDSAPNRLWGLVAGLSLGQLFFARIDMVLVLLLPAGWLLYQLVTLKWRRADGWFWAAFLGSVGFALFHAILFSRPYTYNTYGALLTIFQRQIGGLLILLLFALLFFGYGLLYQRARLLHLIQRAADSQRLRHLLAASVVLLSLYGYFVRPVLGEVIEWPYWYAGTMAPISNHENLLRLGWYLSPLAIWLAVLGTVLVLEREQWRFMWPMMAAGGAFTVVYIYNIVNNPIQIYAMRRYLPVTVPSVVILVGYSLIWFWRHKRRQPAGRIICTALSIVLVGWLLYNSRLIWRQVDFATGIEQMDQLAAMFETDSELAPIVLFVDDAPVGTGAVFGTPLQYLYDITAFDLQENALDMRLLSTQIERWQQDQHPIYAVRKEGSTPVFDSERLTLIGSIVWDTPMLELTYDHMPSTIQRSRYPLEIYRIRDYPPAQAQ